MQWYREKERISSIPSKVEYSLTAKGMTLMPILAAMCN